MYHNEDSYHDETSYHKRNDGLINIKKLCRHSGSEENMENAVIVEDIVKSFKGIRVLDHVNISFEKGKR